MAIAWSPTVAVFLAISDSALQLRSVRIGHIYCMKVLFIPEA